MQALFAIILLQSPLCQRNDFLSFYDQEIRSSYIEMKQDTVDEKKTRQCARNTINAIEFQWGFFFLFFFHKYILIHSCVDILWLRLLGLSTRASCKLYIYNVPFFGSQRPFFLLPGLYVSSSPPA